MTNDRGDAGPRRRRSPRVVGPFKARWIGAVTVPLVIHDLGAGGCMVLSSNTTLPAKRMTLEIDLPTGDCVTVTAEPLYVRSNLGFAARFIDVPDATRMRLERIIAALTASGGGAAR